MHAPTAGILGAAGYPPKPPAGLAQHLNWAGPGQNALGEVAPAQSLCQRQLPPGKEASPHLGLEQQRTEAASAGQAPGMVVPPALLQAEVLTQTPERPLGP